MIKMLCGIAGSNFSVAPGEKTDLFSKDEEKRLIESGAAEAVATPKAKKKK